MKRQLPDKAIDRALDAYADEHYKWSWRQRYVGIYDLIRDDSRTRVFRPSRDPRNDSVAYQVLPIIATDDKAALETYQNFVHRAAMTKALETV